MIVYRLIWGDRHKVVTEWFGAKKELVARKALIRRRIKQRPYDQIELLFSGKIDVPTDKQGLIVWLNANATGGN